MCLALRTDLRFSHFQAGALRRTPTSAPIDRVVREALWQAELLERRLRVRLWRGEQLENVPAPDRSADNQLARAELLRPAPRASASTANELAVAHEQS